MDNKTLHLPKTAFLKTRDTYGSREDINEYKARLEQAIKEYSKDPMTCFLMDIYQALNKVFDNNTGISDIQFIDDVLSQISENDLTEDNRLKLTSVRLAFKQFTSTKKRLISIDRPRAYLMYCLLKEAYLRPSKGTDKSSHIILNPITRYINGNTFVLRFQAYLIKNQSYGVVKRLVKTVAIPSQLVKDFNDILYQPYIKLSITAELTYYLD